MHQSMNKQLGTWSAISGTAVTKTAQQSTVLSFKNDRKVLFAYVYFPFYRNGNDLGSASIWAVTFLRGKLGSSDLFGGTLEGP